MPLHLLHHKSWHVYNTVNVEKVERDKENARRKEEEEEMRMNQADQERRLQQLRGNAYGTDYKPPPSPSSPVSRPSNVIPGLKKSTQAATKHVNLFEDLEAVPKVEGNKEREIEIAAEKKKWEDLVTSKLVNATKDHKPWYSQLDRVSGLEKDKSEVERELKEKREMKWKEEADPLKKMEGFLKRKREVDVSEKRKLERMERELTERERRSGSGRTPERYSRDDKSGERKHQLRHHKRSPSRSHSPSSKDQKHRHRHRSPVSSRSEESTEIERLREERRKREAIESERVQHLINKKKVNESRYEAVGHGGYSAQFHPEAVRR
jgi:hypothetical protein